MTLGLKTSQKRKEKLFAIKIKHPSEQNKDKFKAYNTIYKKLRRAAKQMYFKNKFFKFTQLWTNLVSDKRDNWIQKKDKSHLHDFFKDNDNIILDYLEITNGFNIFFSQVGPKLASDIEHSDIPFDSFLSEKSPVNFSLSKYSENLQTKYAIHWTKTPQQKHYQSL